MAEESPEIQVPLQELVTGTEPVESGGEPDPQGKFSERHYRLCIIVLGAVSLTLFITVIVLAGQHGKSPSADLGPPAGPACPDGWVGHRGKCYYFSEDEGNWTYSQTHCSALNASLAGIDTRQDMDFMVRCKCRFDHWIGLRRDPGQPWKWANGTEFNNWFQIGGGDGDCAYLNNQNTVRVSSSQCTGVRYWICSKPDVFTKGKQTAGAGG